MRTIVRALTGGVMTILLAACHGAEARQNLSREKTVGPSMEFLKRTYHLGSFNQKSNPMWEFVTRNETVGNWTSLLTIVERTEATTREDLDRLAQGILSSYKSRNGQILIAKAMVGKAGEVFNYAAVAFEDVARHRFELSFTKIALGPRNAYVLVYGVRIGDPDYVSKAKAFLTQHSGEIGLALENAVMPDISTLPRKEF
jgi:hypothetical protein